MMIDCSLGAAGAESPVTGNISACLWGCGEAHGSGCHRAQGTAGTTSPLRTPPWTVTAL